ncbi:MAG: polysaccharide biosynthesis protein [Saprospiraceae bacterium]
MLNLPRWGILGIDLVITVISIGIAYLLRFNFDIPSEEFKFFQIAIPLIFVIRLASFFIFKTYAGVIFHTSIEDAQRIFYAVTSGSVFLCALTPLVAPYLDYHIIPYSIIIIDYILMIFLMVAFRAFIKVMYMELRNVHKDKKNVIIYGAGMQGIMTKKTLDRDMGANYHVNAFVDDNINLRKKRLLGIEIFPAKHLERLLLSSQPDIMIISTLNIPAERKQELVELCLRYRVKVLNVPPMDKWINGELSFKQIKAIRIEDLLERAPIKLNFSNIEKQLNGKTILITGAAGSIGSEIVRQVVQFNPKKIILLDQAETPLYEIDLEIRNNFTFCNYETVIGDVRNEERMRNVFRSFHPDIIYHAAAYKHVPLMEHNPSEAILTNIKGTKVIADLAVEFEVEKFVLVSTDKAVNPTSIMGASKRVAEIYIQAFNSSIANQQRATKFITTRFGNVLGSNGSVIPLFKRQIAEGGPVTVTHPDMTRFFMTIPEACQLVLEAGAMGQGGEIYVFDMGASIKILDLAKRMIKLSGLTLGTDIHIAYTGLRPGEKLYEELLNVAEHTKPTHHKKIMIGEVRQYDFEKVKSDIELLIALFKSQNNKKLVRLLKDLIPEYKSNNSIFEQLDQ